MLLTQKIIKKIIRGKIGFKGILISDDISMNILKISDPLQNSIKALKSGCNLVLYCEPRPLKSLQLVRKLPHTSINFYTTFKIFLPELICLSILTHLTNHSL